MLSQEGLDRLQAVIRQMPHVQVGPASGLRHPVCTLIRAAEPRVRIHPAGPAGKRHPGSPQTWQLMPDHAAIRFRDSCRWVLTYENDPAAIESLGNSPIPYHHCVYCYA